MKQVTHSPGKKAVNHKLSSVAACQYIRSLHGVVEAEIDQEEGNGNSSTSNPPLVFEWMEHVLAKLPSDAFRKNSDLPRIIAKSVLSALAVLKTQFNAIHTGAYLLSTPGQ